VTSAEGNQEEAQGRNWLEIAQTLAAYVAIPVALVYPFGFLALFVQFTHYFNLDFYTAWYAASLVNRMVAIGQGVNILALALVLSVLLSATIAQILLKHERSTSVSLVGRRGFRVKLRRFVRRHMRDAKRTILLMFTLLLYIFYSRIVAGGRLDFFVLRGRKSTECIADKIWWHQLQLWPDSIVPALLFLAGCTIGGGVIYRSYRSYRRSHPTEDYRLRPGTFVRGVTEGWMRYGLAFAYGSSVVASIMLAWFTPAYIPYMTYGHTVEYHGGKEPTENHFLSNFEGQWYFLHRIEPENVNNPDEEWVKPEYRIVSLAVAQVDHVRVRANPPRASRVAPLPFGLGEPPLRRGKELSKNHCEFPSLKGWGIRWGINLWHSLSK
jgi:hypothetical protein